MTYITRHLKAIEAALEKLGSIELEKATPDWRGESQVLKDARNSINAIYDIHPTLYTTEYDANTLAKTILMHASFDFEDDYTHEVERVTKIITDALLAAKQSTQINDGVLNDRYQNGAGLVGGTDIGDEDLQAALNYWGDMDYKNGCEFAQYILLTYRKRFDELLASGKWLPIDDMAKKYPAILAKLKYRDGGDGGIVTIRWHEPWKQWVMNRCLIGLQNNIKDDENCDPTYYLPLDALKPSTDEVTP